MSGLRRMVTTLGVLAALAYDEIIGAVRSQQAARRIR